MEEKKEEKRDNHEETKKGLKIVNKIIFLPNEEVPDHWTDFDLSVEEVRILNEGEEYIDKKLIPSLSISRKATKEELEDNTRPVRENKKELKIEAVEKVKEKAEKEQRELRQEEIDEINMLLKTKARTLKMKELEETEKQEKYKRVSKEDEEKRKREEIERLHN